ncbi:MAG: hypothetical protein ACFFDU_00725 [Candidatus Thorarchaeota archaeon]
MADEGTARTLVTIGAWLQLIFWLIGIAGIAFTFMMFLPFWDPLIMIVFLMAVAFYILITIFGIIFFILWFRWRHDPSAHKTGLIVTGILGLIFSGVLPGLLVLIGGAIAPSEA